MTNAKKSQYYTVINMKDEMDVYLSQCSKKFTPEQNLCCELLRRAIEDVKSLPPSDQHHQDALEWLLDIKNTKAWSVGYVLDNISRSAEHRAFYEDAIFELVATRH